MGLAGAQEVHVRSFKVLVFLHWKHVAILPETGWWWCWDWMMVMMLLLRLDDGDDDAAETGWWWWCCCCNPLWCFCVLWTNEGCRPGSVLSHWESSHHWLCTVFHAREQKNQASNALWLAERQVCSFVYFQHHSLDMQCWQFLSGPNFFPFLF